METLKEENKQSIIDIRNQNKKIYLEIGKLEEMKKILIQKIEANKKKIQDSCEHVWEGNVVYGERTQYICIHCGLY